MLDNVEKCWKMWNNVARWGLIYAVESKGYVSMSNGKDAKLVRKQFITLILSSKEERFMATSAKATVTLKLKSDKKLFSLISALKPEVEAPVTRRAKVELKKEGLFLILTVEAEDTVALRATLNAYLRWVGSAANVLELIDDQFSG